MAVKYFNVSSFGLGILSVSIMGLSVLSSFPVNAQSSTDQPILDPTPPDPALNSEPTLTPISSPQLDKTPNAMTNQPERRQNRCRGKLPALNPLYQLFVYN